MPLKASLLTVLYYVYAAPGLRNNIIFPFKPSLLKLEGRLIVTLHCSSAFDRFTVLCSVTCILLAFEWQRGCFDRDLFAFVTLMPWLALEQLNLRNKNSEVCIKTRSVLASLPVKGQATEQTTVKWPIVK